MNLAFTPGWAGAEFKIFDRLGGQLEFNSRPSEATTVQNWKGESIAGRHHCQWVVWTRRLQNISSRF